MARLIRHEKIGPQEVKPQEKSVWICMCGLSQNLPCCDGAHKAARQNTAAAKIPDRPVGLMVIVVQAVNHSLGLPEDQQLPLASVGIILGVDRILDLCRTTVNVWGDSVGAKLISRIAPDPVNEEILL